MSYEKYSPSNDPSLLTPSVFQTAMEKMNVSVNDSGEVKPNCYTCTPKALEVLRQCHGQFVSLIASELASFSEEKDPKADSVDVSKIERIRNVKPSNVMDALKRLEFNDIVSKLEHCNVLKAQDHDSESNPQLKKAGKRKRIAILKDSKLSEEELIKEQDRLIAISIQRAKDQLTNK